MLQRGRRVGFHQYGLTPMDATHLAAAIWWQYDTLLVWDKPFTSIFGENDPVIEGVQIKEPFWIGQAQF